MKRYFSKTLLALAIIGLALTPALVAQPAHAANAVFDAIWQRTDLPVQQGLVSRSWVWGNQLTQDIYEPYAQGPNGTHMVRYYDKSRMEVNHPDTAPNTVSNGLLVVDMINGRIQVGDNQYQQASPANIQIGGDTPGSNPLTPRYSDLAPIMAATGSRIGGDVIATYASNQIIGSDPARAGQVTIAAYSTQTGHNIPSVFWSFMNASGTIWNGSAYVQGQVMDWLSALGYPITEPYWTVIRVGGHDRSVMFQAFQRRILTFTPTNPGGFRVEMGNVGAQYFNWRYPNGIGAGQNCSAATLNVFNNVIAHSGNLSGLLGCPTDAGLSGSNIISAWESFQRGQMIWVRNQNDPNDKSIYVLYTDGSYQVYADTWSDGQPVSGGLTPPAGLFEPVRGFGKVWRDQTGVQTKLGWATATEVGGGGARQGFQFATMFYIGANDQVYSLFYTNGDVHQPTGRWQQYNR